MSKALALIAGEQETNKLWGGKALFSKISTYFPHNNSGTSCVNENDLEVKIFLKVELNAGEEDFCTAIYSFLREKI